MAAKKQIARSRNAPVRIADRDDDAPLMTIDYRGPRRQLPRHAPRDVRQTPIPADQLAAFKAEKERAADALRPRARR